MDFGNWANKLRESASKAADAARTFKGFDDMAERDDYIHSNDLNVNNNNSNSNNNNNNNKRNRSEGSKSSTSMIDHPSSQETKDRQRIDSDSNNKSLSRPWNSLEQDGRSNDMYNSTITTTTGIRNQYDDNMHETWVDNDRDNHHHKKLSSDPLAETTTNNNNSISHSNETYYTTTDEYDHGCTSYDSNNVDANDDNDDENDHHHYPNTTTTTTTKKTSSKKNANRFMEDLERRMSQPLELSASQTDASTFHQQQQQNQDDDQQTTLLQPTVVSFLNNLGAALSFGPANKKHHNQQASRDQRRKSAPPLARFAYANTHKQQEEETYNIVQSNAVLGEDELYELQQLTKGSNSNSSNSGTLSSSFVTRLCLAAFALMRAYPRETFILLTLLLGWFAYFYTRNMTLDDVN